MEENNWRKIETIVDQALALPAEQRQSFVENQCEGHEKLKSEVTLLLESIFKSEGWLEDADRLKRKLFNDEADSDETKYDPEEDALIGVTVGSFILTERIGEGGMGAVYRAEHTGKDINHRVAIKIIRHGQTTQINIQRFNREQQILARLQHPGIARLYDIGVSEDGRPYLIMEYVDGMPLDVYCRQNQCSLNEKIELFKQILQAVSYAHENLVIHRDLKPANILVDENRNIKILDFGISKLLRENEDASLTQTGDRMFTPRYAAPEQIEKGNASTTTDLYALGVILYKLLARRGPFDFENRTRHAIERIILDATPPPPSNRVASKRLREKLRGDLDAIILKAIRKESIDRYRTAAEFLEDLNNYQDGLPVNAVKGSRSYRIKKFYRRHRQGVIAACTTILLIVGLAGFFAYRITQERNQARLEAKKAQNVSEFLMSLFKANKPNKSKGEVVTAQMLLDTGTKQANDLRDQPAVQARMLSIIGEVQLDYGNYEKADSLFLAALKIENTLKKPNLEQKLATMNNYGNLLEKKGEYEAADSVFKIVLSSSEKYNMREQTVTTLNDLGNQAQLESNFFKAESLHRKALKLRTELYGENNKGVAASLNNIGLALQDQGKFKEAEPYYQRSLDLDKQIYGSLHTETTITMRNLGKLYMDMGEMQKADSILTQTVKLTRRLLGNNHPRLAEDLNELAVLKAKQGNLLAADSLFREILSIQKNTLEPDHPRIALTLNNLAWIAGNLGKTKIAEQYYTEALDIARHRYGTNHVKTAMYAQNLASELIREHKYKEAEPLYRQAISTLRKLLPTEHLNISDPLYNLGRLFRKTGRPKESEPLLREALTIRKKQLGQNHLETAVAQAALGRTLIDLKNYKEAKIFLEKSYTFLEAHHNNKYKLVKKWLTEVEKLQQ